MRLWIFLALFISLPSGSLYIRKFYSGDTDCSDPQRVWLVFQGIDCTPDPTCQNLNNVAGQVIECPDDYDVPQGWTEIEIWPSNTECDGWPLSTLVIPDEECSGAFALSTFQLNCDDQTIQMCNSVRHDCHHTICPPVPGRSGGDCVEASAYLKERGVQSYKWRCQSDTTTSTTTTEVEETTAETTTLPNDNRKSSNQCFHSSTAITRYDGSIHGTQRLADFFNHEFCRIPHIVRSDGLSISTSCGEKLRVTPEHLVFTSRGLIEAADINLNDFLQSRDQMCRVILIHVEKDQEYFGLNCVNSVVYANGYKVSTFGHMHIIPAFYMNIVSLIFGVEKASRWGNMIAEYYFSLLN